MKKIIRYKGKVFKVTLNEDVTLIKNSYRVKNVSDMKHILSSLQDYVINLAVNKRSVSSMINEWRTHNLLYLFNIKRDRTDTVDLEYPESLLMKVIYTIISPFYLHFS